MLLACDLWAKVGLKVADLDDAGALGAGEVAATVAVAALKEDAVEVGEGGGTGDGLDLTTEPAGLGVDGDGATARIASREGDFVGVRDEQSVAGAIKRGNGSGVDS